MSSSLINQNIPDILDRSEWFTRLFGRQIRISCDQWRMHNILPTVRTNIDQFIMLMQGNSIRENVPEFEEEWYKTLVDKVYRNFNGVTESLKQLADDTKDEPTYLVGYSREPFSIGEIVETGNVLFTDGNGRELKEFKLIPDQPNLPSIINEKV